MQVVNWFDVFGVVCNRGHEALEWGLPEPWIHAELYVELKKRTSSTGWEPFSKEVPYVTFYPVQLPKKGGRDWKSSGAVKWVDLCLYAADSKAWCWFEFKVRHAGQGPRELQAARSARDAFRKDVVALVGLDVDRTADTWEQPDNYTTAYWFETLLKHRASDVRAGNHHFVSAFLQLGGSLNSDLWTQQALTKEINAWLAHRQNAADRDGACPAITISFSNVAGQHALVVCTWAV
jgi:hypothetical protein